MADGSVPCVGALVPYDSGMAKGWKPTTPDSGGASDGAPPAPPSPAPPRRTRSEIRRERKEREAQLAADTPLATAMQENSPRKRGAIEKPPPGQTNSARDRERISLSVQLGDRWSRIVRDVKQGVYSWTEFVDSLDDEEIARAQLKDVDGGFRGRPPSFVPREFVLACQRDQKRRFEEIFSKDVLDMARELVEIARDKTNVKPETRLKALQYGMERIFGGIPKDIRVSQEQPWEQMVVNVVSEGETGMPEHLSRRYGGYAERQGGAAPEEE